MKNIIDRKIRLLYHFNILRRNGRAKDSRENATRELLTRCGTEFRMQSELHDVLIGRIELTELLEVKGLI